MDAITQPADLRGHYGPVNPLAARKVLGRLDRHCRHFIGLSPFLVLATADGHGGVDASPRGDAPGFVQVLDEVTLLLPDRRGNNRVDSFSNLLAAPGLGLIFFVPGIDETLRVNGSGRIITDPALLAVSEVQGKIPSAGLLVSVREAFFHCAKALIRSRLWDPARHVPRASFPSLGRIIAEQTGACSAEDAERSTEEGYRTRLY
ncbi:MAG: pyridoxamine 5'-phosphate oxidase family protein [Acidisphaera sp.]|nr:pyridoxamine 5'-phosphate oxidase family protein [Acidisphaera sp.]